MDDGPAPAQPSRPAIESEPLSDDVAIVHLRGEHDLSAKPELSAALEVASERSRAFVDLSDCTFMMIDTDVQPALIRLTPAGRGYATDQAALAASAGRPTARGTYYLLAR